MRLKMNWPRSTFARILISARKRMADALLNGKAIKIEGGNHELTKRSRCDNDHEWEIERTARKGTDNRLKCRLLYRLGVSNV